MIPFAWFLTPLGKKVGIGILIILALTAIGWKIYSAGQHSGEAKQKDVQKLDINAARVEDHSQTDSKLQQNSQEGAGYKEAVRASNVRADGWQKVAEGLLEDRKRAAVASASMSDPELHPANARLLGEPEGQSCYSPRGERRINEALTQFPVCEKQVETANKEHGEREAAMLSMAKALGAAEERAKMLEELRKRDDQRFRDVFNLDAPRVRAGKCVWIWKCGRSKAKPDAVALPVPG